MGWRSPFPHQPDASGPHALPPDGPRVPLQRFSANPFVTQDTNVLAEITGGGLTKAEAVCANELDVQVSEGFGRLKSCGAQPQYGFRQGDALDALAEGEGFAAWVDEEFLLRLEVFAAFVEAAGGGGR